MVYEICCDCVSHFHWQYFNIRIYLPTILIKCVTTPYTYFVTCILNNVIKFVKIGEVDEGGQGWNGMGLDISPPHSFRTLSTVHPQLLNRFQSYLSAMLR